MEKISQHVSYAEAIKSQAAIRNRFDNTPGAIELANMKKVAEMCFEPLRKHFNCPIGISSFYRSRFVNTLIGGAKNSQHLTGQAMDIDADIFGGVTNAQIFEWLKKNVDFDQLIWEYGDDKNPAWVHISYVSPQKNRRQILRIKR
jgi:zinc D-Ala-D-Ala carboxypeptidase